MTRLDSWRSVITPHPDIAAGKYSDSEFMADLGNAANGTAGSEYSDAVEFFRRTKLTEGLRNLLVKSLKRVCGQGGEPVIQIKTAFGGGKTHSMIALYHLMNGGAGIESNVDIRGVFEEAGVFVRPKVKVAVLACTQLDPNKIYEVSGIKVNTLWGNMAAQLGGYEYVRNADMSGVAPGADSLTEMFNECGPCVVLIDELVLYGRNLPEKEGLRSGTFDSFLTFIHNLTEAAKFSRNSLVAATLPESNDQAGGRKGITILHKVSDIFARLESVWKPITANEGFEIVRKRLFLECHNPSERERTADAFSSMYANNAVDFPSEASKSGYRQRIIECYPFHPELFDRLYGDWATLENFQRTRGVLRFLAGVVYRLWTGGDMNALIMPGSLPLNFPDVREKLIKALPNSDGWNAIVDSDIDGENSSARRIDVKERFAQYSAALRTARTILLGSAPSERTQVLRGIDEGHIRLGSVQSGENISSYNDAVSELKKELAYLYAEDSRVWFDTRPTLKRIAKGLEDDVKMCDVSEEVTRRLKRLMQGKEPFVLVHVCPKSDDVPDDQNLRLVVLGLEGDKDSAMEILKTKMNQLRANRNMIVFLIPDGVQLDGVRSSARSYLAWSKLYTKGKDKGLDLRQMDEVKESLASLNNELDGLIVRAWNCVLSGHTEKGKNFDDIVLEELKLNDTDGDIVGNVAECLTKRGLLSDNWAAEHLSLTLKNLVWDASTEDIAVKTLWEYVCKFCYMPRLKNFDALVMGIRKGVEAGYFGLAESKAEGKYTSLRLKESVILVDEGDIVVRKDVAESQIAAEKTVQETQTLDTDGQTTTIADITPQPETPKVKRGCNVSVNVDADKFQRDTRRIFDDIILCLQEAPNAKFRIRVEVYMTTPESISEGVEKAVRGNCKHMDINFCDFVE